MEFIKKNGKGILLCFVIAVICWLLGKQFPIIGGPVFAIISGMIITLIMKDKTQFESGIKYTSKKILQYAVILLGFGLNLQVILQTGAQSLPIILATISISSSTIIFSLMCPITSSAITNTGHLYSSDKLNALIVKSKNS